MDEFLSTRLFPKHQGADAYRLTGVARLCDWVITSDSRAPQIHFWKLCEADPPKTVFLSLRSPEVAIQYFFEAILPSLKSPVILITGSEDVTVPRQLDARWSSFASPRVELLRNLPSDPLIHHWFAENLDEDLGPSVSPLPVGMVYQDPQADRRIQIPETPPFAERDVRALCAHRVRRGPQWALRKKVYEYARTDWSEFCDVREGELPEDEYFSEVASRSFVICAEGGGLDPSPKAWQTLLHGGIPIIRRTAASAAYTVFPCVFVDQWKPDCLSLAKLRRYKARFTPWFERAALRSLVVQRLGLRYWWSRVQKKITELDSVENL